MDNGRDSFLGFKKQNRQAVRRKDGKGNRRRRGDQGVPFPFPWIRRLLFSLLEHDDLVPVNLTQRDEGDLRLSKNDLFPLQSSRLILSALLFRVPKP